MVSIARCLLRPVSSFLLQIFGLLSNHGAARSSCPPSCSRRDSSANLPMNCTPQGRPSLLQWSGTDMAGCPVKFASWVKGILMRLLVAMTSANPDAFKIPPRLSELMIFSKNSSDGFCFASPMRGKRSNGGRHIQIVFFIEFCHLTRKSVPLTPGQNEITC